MVNTSSGGHLTLFGCPDESPDFEARFGGPCRFRREWLQRRSPGSRPAGRLSAVPTFQSMRTCRCRRTPDSGSPEPVGGGLDLVIVLQCQGHVCLRRQYPERVGTEPLVMLDEAFELGG